MTASAEVENLTCEECGRPFVKKTSLHFCGRSCSMTHSNRRLKGTSKFDDDGPLVVDPSKYTKLVMKIAWRYVSSDERKRCKIEDTQQFSDGMFGLFLACKRFDPLKGKPFVAFARTYIRGYILDGRKAWMLLEGQRVSMWSNVREEGNGPRIFRALSREPDPSEVNEDWKPFDVSVGAVL
jgi:hypothetical protein